MHENDDDPRIIAETRQYFRDFNHLNTATTTARRLNDARLETGPDRVNRGSLWGAANTAKKQAKRQYVRLAKSEQLVRPRIEPKGALVWVSFGSH
jgi:hypothetical protein